MGLERGLAPDDETLLQLTQEQDSPLAGESVARLRWPDEPLRSILIREYLSELLSHHHSTDERWVFVVAIHRMEYPFSH